MKYYTGYNNPSNPVSEFHGAKLTARQIQITKLLANALSLKDIGKKLKITEKTVKFHLTRIYNNKYYKSIGATNRLKLMKHIMKCECKEKDLA